MFEYRNTISFIKCCNATANIPVWIRVDRIESIFEIRKGVTAVKMIGYEKGFYEVKESVDDVMRAILGDEEYEEG